MSSSAFPSGLRTYSPLGKSGLLVSPLCLGTMTFGTEWGWGVQKDTAFALMERFLEAGGNFIDTADGYTNGTSEELIGEYLHKKERREHVVLATKFTFNAKPGDPNAGGNGRKNILRALHGSLKRLKTDYVDLYWVHAWDGRTPIEEVVGTLDALVCAGSIRHYGLSNCPAWYIGRALTLAELRGQERACALQHEYSLVERNIEREHVPAALELGLGITAWSPLASGMLTGKYQRDALDAGRLGAVKDSGNPGFEKLFTDRNWRIVDVLKDVARQVERTPAQVALSWVAHRPAVASVLIGATKVAQLEDNLGALDFELPGELSARLEEAGRPETVHPYHFFEPTLRAMIDGGATVVRR